MPSWFREVADEVRRHTVALEKSTPDRAAAIQEQLRQLEGRRAGFLQSLGDPEISSTVRQAVQAEFDRVDRESESLRAELAAMASLDRKIEEAMDPKDVMSRLHRLSDVLSSANATETNFELSLHIEAIRVDADRRVEMRTCKLGAFNGAVELLSEGKCENQKEIPLKQQGSHQHRVKNRRRPRHRLLGMESATSVNVERRVCDAEFATDAHRFDGLDDPWFWCDALPIERPLPWPQAHAEEVANLRAQDPEKWSYRKLGEHFGVTKPTIGAALRFHEQSKSKPKSAVASSDTEGDSISRRDDSADLHHGARATPEGV